MSARGPPHPANGIAEKNDYLIQSGEHYARDEYAEYYNPRRNLANGSVSKSFDQTQSDGSFRSVYSYDGSQPHSSRHSAPGPSKSKRKHVVGQKKPCNCTKSMCLKLYCDCFANGEFCSGCNCKDCHNNLEYDADRTRAIKQSLERNPNAFKPKIGVAKGGQSELERLHQKGCHCKKSGCLKNYCECYEAKVPCTDRCKCKGCQNTETDRCSRNKDKLANSALMNLANAATSSQRASTSRAISPVSDDDSEPDATEPADPRRYPWFYLTDDVIKAAADCMLAQADESSRTTSKENSLVNEDAVIEDMERLVLREFGRCLDQIFTSASNS